MERGYGQRRNGIASVTWAAFALVLAAPVGGQTVKDAISQTKDAVSLTSVPTECKPYAVAVGQRLQKPGKERITATGTLYWVTNGVARTSAVSVVWQNPLKIRIDGLGAAIGVDGAKTGAPGQAAKDNADTVESLLDDSVEGLISLNMQSGGSRVIGRGFRDKGATLTAPAYDVVQMLYGSTLRNGASISKFYWFDSKTKLLSRVTYKSTTGGAVEVRSSNWQRVNGEAIPFVVERQENGQVTVRLTLTSATVSGGAQDGIFGGN